MNDLDKLSVDSDASSLGCNVHMGMVKELLMDSAKVQIHKGFIKGIERKTNLRAKEPYIHGDAMRWSTTDTNVFSFTHIS